VTSEDDFQAALDANPGDWQTRLAFADWLQERGDPRAEGYRAMGLKRVHPIHIQINTGPDEKELWQYIFGTDQNDSQAAQTRYGACLLPGAWFKKLTRKLAPDRTEWWRYFNTRGAADTAAVLAFAKLPAERRAELLTPPVLPKRKPPKRKPAKAAKPKTTARKRTKG
jgi:uncharacterized protein (TIGR02996 family)